MCVSEFVDWIYMLCIFVFCGKEKKYTNFKSRLSKRKSWIHFHMYEFFVVKMMKSMCLLPMAYIYLFDGNFQCKCYITLPFIHCHKENSNKILYTKVKWWFFLLLNKITFSDDFYWCKTLNDAEYHFRSTFIVSTSFNMNKLKKNAQKKERTIQFRL